MRRNCVPCLRCFCCIGFVAAWLAVVGDIVAWLSAAWKCLRGRASFNQCYEPGATGNRRYYEPDSRSTGTGSGRPYKQGELGELYTNLYKLVQALKESNRKEQEEKIFLRDIMSDISHQLKTPLASLTVFLDLLYDGRVPDVDKQKQMLLESKNQVSRMEWMVLSMLKLARIEAGAIQFEKHPCSLYAIVAQAKESVAYLTEKRGQQIDVQIDEKQMLVCDGDWLTEAIINLLKNASDYSGEQTTIHIWTEDNPMYTRIYVKDEGCGIAESELKNIFKRFYRINKEVNPNSVGIGLSLTKSIVEGMGGKISVRSEFGSYTQFILTFVHT